MSCNRQSLSVVKPIMSKFAFVVVLASCAAVPVVLASCAAVPGAEPYRDINGIYPHLATYNSAGECGTGVVVPWAGPALGRYVLAAFRRRDLDDKLYEITPDLKARSYVRKASAARPKTG